MEKRFLVHPRKVYQRKSLKKGTHTYRINKEQAAAITAENRFQRLKFINYLTFPSLVLELLVSHSFLLLLLITLAFAAAAAVTPYCSHCNFNKNEKKVKEAKREQEKKNKKNLICCFFVFLV